jgi:tetratricopeptide (TPR) repeat protein
MRALAGIVACALLAVAAPAHANDKRAAAAAFKQGRALYEAGQYGDALDKFKSGYDAYPLPGFLVNIGQCQRKLDRLDEAQAAFQQFLASDSTDERTRAEVHEALEQIATEKQRRAEVQEALARRQRDQAEAAHPPVIDDDSKPDLRVHAAPAVAAAVAGAAPAATVSVEKPKKRRWVWAIVGVLAVGAAASAVTVGVLESRPPPLHPGSLGLLDGRR